VLRVLEGLEAGTSKAVQQPDAGVSYAQKLSKAESAIDWRRGAADIDRQIRAFNPWPTAETRLDTETVKLLRSRFVATRSSNASAGTLLGLHGDALEVACGEGVLQVLELQRAGRKPVVARDFFNAMRLAPGAQAVFT
jgi:methionyl-tRNA formyltransferase